MRPAFRRQRFRVPAADEELLTAWLWTEGVEGISSEAEPAAGASAVVVATFREEKKLLAKGDLPAWLPAVEILDSVAVEESDWLAVWRENASPILLGDQLLVDPREWDAPRDPVAAGGRFVLEIPARTAFGVGSHESTRLAYELLEATELRGRSVLDVGCGSGILAMAALRLGARRAVGFDFDPAAALLAGQYARHNVVGADFFLGTVAAVAPRVDPFDVVVLNVLPHEIADELDAVVEALRHEGELLVSGVLATEAAGVTAAIERLGCERTGDLAAGEWIGLRFRRGALAEPRA
jgi:ribosomal protein L11 methyltransferase